MDIFFEIHKDLPREGPGDPASTRKALSFVPTIPRDGKVLDIGCGPGMQTLDLAKNTDGSIEALDTHPPFLEALTKNIEKAGLRERVVPRNHSMFQLDYPFESIDLIWSEGAIYIMGFEKGLKAWKEFVKPGGHIVVSELSWLKKERSNRTQAFWGKNYPGISSIAKNIKTIEHLGFVPTAHFILPEASWWEYYYTPMLNRIKELEKIHQGDEKWAAALKEQLEEVELFRQHAEEYGYVFYIMKKI